MTIATGNAIIILKDDLREYLSRPVNVIHTPAEQTQF